jgi:hypothetical protein
MSVIDDFKARFPEFDADTVDSSLPALEDVWPCYWGGNYEDCGKEIVLNLLAHLLVVHTKPGSGNPKSEQSKSVGNVSVSYGEYTPNNNRMAWFKTTKYGSQYLMLTRKRQGAFFV